MILPLTVITSPGFAVVRMRWMGDGCPVGAAASTADRVALGALVVGTVTDASFLSHEARKAKATIAMLVVFIFIDSWC
jgi:hypothetical protein